MGKKAPPIRSIYNLCGENKRWKGYKSETTAHPIVNNVNIYKFNFLLDCS